MKGRTTRPSAATTPKRSMSEGAGWAGVDRYTPDQIEEAIARALGAGDIEAVQSLMLALAWKDARRAQEVYDVMELGIAYRKAGLDG